MRSRDFIVTPFPLLFIVRSRDSFLLVFNPLARDLFLYKNQSTRPSHFILHCKQASRQVKKKRKSSKQVSKQASKEERRKEKCVISILFDDDIQRENGVCDLSGTREKSIRIGMLSPTMSCPMCQPMEKGTSHHLLSSLQTSHSHLST